MLPALCAATPRTIVPAVLMLLFLVPLQARAQETLYLRLDGVSGGGDASTPLGKDAFPVQGFSVTAGQEAAIPSAAVVVAAGPTPLADVSFNMSVAVPTVPLWHLAVQGKVVPKASLVALDGATRKVRYRIDLEQVVVRSIGLQTLGTREAVVGTLGYERIRLSYGEGKTAVTAGWDRVRNAPWN